MPFMDRHGLLGHPPRIPRSPLLSNSLRLPPKGSGPPRMLSSPKRDSHIKGKQKKTSKEGEIVPLRIMRVTGGGPEVAGQGRTRLAFLNPFHEAHSRNRFAYDPDLLP